jgi:8'-apo-carotenoid 13,14-cleaving dioxygenase
MRTYLDENFAPVEAEVTAFDLPVIGQLPPELSGRYLRNGPNPFADLRDDQYHWFLGDGMVHGIRIDDGKAKWYRNRYVGSDRVAQHLGRPIDGPHWRPDTPTGGPNTNVGGFAGRTWAMVEAGGTPVELTYELETVGRNDFFGTLPASFTAHPKVDPATGEMHAMVYAPGVWFDHVQYVVVGTDGRVRKTVDIPCGMTMMHDMSLTSKYAIVFDFPVTLDINAAFAGSKFPLRWNPDYGSRVGLLPRQGTAEDIVWVDAPICYAFHPMNAYDRADGSVVIDLCVYETLFKDDIRGPFGDSLPRLERWEVNPQRTKISTTVIDNAPQEFPRHAHRVGCAEYRYGYTAGFVGETLNASQLGPTLKYDLVTGERSSYDYGPGVGGGEPVFVERPNATAEDDGWLMTFTHAHDGSTASFVVLDAQDLARGPVAEVPLPQRIPYGFHGNWVSDRSVAPS